MTKSLDTFIGLSQRGKTERFKAEGIQCSCVHHIAFELGKTKFLESFGDPEFPEGLCLAVCQSSHSKFTLSLPSARHGGCSR